MENNKEKKLWTNVKLFILKGSKEVKRNNFYSNLKKNYMGSNMKNKEYNFHKYVLF